MANNISPFSIGNIRYFIAFRVFFNARFYYPVFTILFLDYGLTIEQFALLNSVWAGTIVLAEVPSGALADFLGRKQLLLITSLLMIGEMALLSFVPLGNINLIFWVFFINRIFSGLAEAMASGADEALAYDSLIEDGNPKDWPRVLSLMMRIKAIGAVISMSLGALIYDPGIVNRLLEWVGLTTNIDQQVSMRYPIYLTLVLGILALFSVMKMKETRPLPVPSHEPKNTVAKLWQLNVMTWKAGKWIMCTPFALTVILVGMTYDHTLRMIITMVSQYFRLIDLPESSFGLIGAGISLLNILVARITEKMISRYTPLQNMFWMMALSFSALIGLTGFFPYYGIVPIILVSAGLAMTSFFTSHYLNTVTPSHLRATILSFKGLAFNLAYGLIGILFASLILQLRIQNGKTHVEWPQVTLANHSFKEAIAWFPYYMTIILALALLVCWYQQKKNNIQTTKDEIS